MKYVVGVLCCFATVSMAATAQVPSGSDGVAAKFGSRETVLQASLSPDGKSIALLVPAGDRGTSLTVITLGGAAP